MSVDRSILGEQSGIEKEASSFVGDEEFRRGDGIVELLAFSEKPGVPAFGDHDAGEIKTPQEAIRRILGCEPWISQGEQEEFFLLFAKLFVFLNHLEAELARLYLKPSDFTQELAFLADEACVLKEVTREAMARLQVSAKAVPYSPQPCRDCATEAVDQSQAPGSTDADDDSFDHGSAVDSFKHQTKK